MQLGFAMVRLLAFFVLTQLGRLIAAPLLIIGGIALGFTSHAIMYPHVAQTTYHIWQYDENTGTYYVQRPGNSQLYVFTFTDFTPYADPETLQAYGSMPDNRTLVAEVTYNAEKERTRFSDSSQTYEVYRVIQLKAAADPGKEFTTIAYREYPTGYYDNRWPYGAGMAGFGALLLLVSFYVYWSDKHFDGTSGKEINILWSSSPWGGSNRSVNPRDLKL
jgi:hypothetical protein